MFFQINMLQCQVEAAAAQPFGRQSNLQS